MAACLAFNSANADEPTIPPSDAEQLTKNKKRVYDELVDLLKPSPDGIASLPPKPAPPPYLKVIEGEERATIIYQCRNTQAENLVDAMESVISLKGTVEPSAQQNLIIISDKADKVDELKATLLALDVKPPQILVEAKIVEVILAEGMDRSFKMLFEKYDQGLNTMSQGGVNLELPEPLIDSVTKELQGGGVDLTPYTSGELGDNWKKFNIAVKWLMSSQDTKILSSPNLIVNIGTTASIVTGQDIPIQSSQFVSGAINTSIEFKRVGVTLNVTPLMINGNMVYLKVNPEVSQVLRYEKFKQGDTTIQNPVVAIRNIETELTMNDEEIVMLGGLYSNNAAKTVESPPILGDIPYIGDLLTSKNASTEETQLIFFLKIKILENTPGDEFWDPGAQAAELRKIGDAIRKSKEIFPVNRMTVGEKISQHLFGEQDLPDAPPLP